MAPGVAPVILSLGRKAISIGREDDCDVALPFDSVSRSHAHIEPTGEDFAIVDHESTNGTYVNNVRVSRCVLHNNDQIRVGSARLVFVQERVRESP